jgi:hypothetical protein
MKMTPIATIENIIERYARGVLSENEALALIATSATQSLLGNQIVILQCSNTFNPVTET